MQIIHGGLLQVHALILEALAVIALCVIGKTWHKTHAFTPTVLAIVLAGLVLFAANNLPFVQSTACDAVKTAAHAGGAAEPGC
jgi:hypothetical protein